MCVWVTHLNRLLRCAKENLRPVSMREFQQHATFTQVSTQSQLQQMSQHLQAKLRERSGLFQYLDLSGIEPDEQNNDNNPDNISNHSRQPEEEPQRKVSQTILTDAQLLSQAQATPVPESPVSSIPNEIERGDDQEMSYSPSYAPSAEETVECETDRDPDQGSTQTDPDMEPVYNVSIFENHMDSDVVIEDNSTPWPELESIESSCVSFSFELPQQQFTRYLKKPDTFLPCLTAAAKKSRNEVKYSDLTSQEKEMFPLAKQKELKCWLDTNTVQAILRDRIHPSRIMSSRWILTWKDDPSSSNGKKAKARLVVKGFQDPDIGSLCSDSPTLTRDSRMLLLQTVASRKWIVQAFDITTAFLRGRSDDRELAMEAPVELQTLLGMSPNQVCLLKGNAYGRVDAPLLFYKEFRKRLEDVGFVAHPLDNCLFLLRNPHNPNVLDGILGTHVDDGIGGGNETLKRQ